jgi:predicted glycosyltransferase
MANVLAGARGVVTMGGYNTISEVLQTGVPALVIPRVRPSEEQLIRANELVTLGLANMLHPDFITPERMWQAVLEMTKRPLRPIDRADYQGAERTAELLMRLVGDHSGRVLAVS